MLGRSAHNYIASLCVSGTSAGVCFADVSTGAMDAAQFAEETPQALKRFCSTSLHGFAARAFLSNSRVLLRIAFSVKGWRRLSARGGAPASRPAQSRYCGSFMRRRCPLSLEDKLLAVSEAGALLDYLSQTQRGGAWRDHDAFAFTPRRSLCGWMRTRAGIWNSETMGTKKKRGSLLWVLDETKTAMGKRLCVPGSSSRLSPGTDYTAAERCGGAFPGRNPPGAEIEALTGIFDLERIMTRIVYGSANGERRQRRCVRH